MPASRDVAVFVGSLRKEAFSRKTANALCALAPSSLSLRILEEQPPESWMAFREEVRAAHAVLFVTPEYNRSVPAALKNALDVASRPYGQNTWDGKPGA